MKNKVYMIEHIWFDSMENNIHAASGYSPVGWVETEKEAKKIVKGLGVCTGKECWAAMANEPKGRYTPIKRYNATSQN